MYKYNSFYLTIVALIVAIGGFLLGFDGVVNSGAVPFYKVSFGISDQPLLIGLSSSVIILGGFMGNLIVGSLGNKVGRKPILMLTSILFMLGALGTALATDITLFILAKLVAGLGVGLAILTAPVYISEIAPSEHRGRLVTFNQLNIVLGLSVAYFSNYYILQLVEDPELNWRWMLGVGFFPAVVYFALLFFIPESPRWLIQHGKDTLGKGVLLKVGGEDYANNEYNNIKENIRLATENKQQTGGLKELFSKKMKWVLTIGFGLAFLQQVSGINAVLYYAPMIFGMTGEGQDMAFIQSIIVGVVFVSVTILSMFLIDRLGRKPLLIIGSSIMAFSLLMTSFFFYKATYTIEQKDINLISKSLLDSEVATLAKLENPNHYSYDKIIYTSDQALLQKEGKTLFAIFLSDEKLANINEEIALLSSTLEKTTDKVFTNELTFFAFIKTVLTAQAEIRYKDKAKIDAVIGKYNNTYKGLILNNSISINAVMVLIGILGFISGFSISVGPVMWAMLPEILPNRLRGLGISVMGGVNAFASFSVATIFPLELEYLGASVTFLIFAVFMLICLVFSLKVVRETKGKTLEQIESELIGEVISDSNEHVEEVNTLAH